MSAFVLDASMALSWCFVDEATEAGDALLARLATEDACAPAIWPLEMANALAVAERRGRIDGAGLHRSLALLASLEVTIEADTHARAWQEVLGLARQERLSVYDAAYLELAMRAGLPLATRDRALAAAASRCGAETIPM